MVRLVWRFGRPADDHHAGEGGSALQVAALPYRVGTDGTLRILLVTSRRSGKWILPKGWPAKGERLEAAAAREAREEAGIKGVVGPELRRIAYVKATPGIHPAERALAVFPLRVTATSAVWRERRQRRRRWFRQSEAAAIVAIPGVGAIIAGFVPAA